MLHTQFWLVSFVLGVLLCCLTVKKSQWSCIYVVYHLNECPWCFFAERRFHLSMLIDGSAIPEDHYSRDPTPPFWVWLILRLALTLQQLTVLTLSLTLTPNLNSMNPNDDPNQKSEWRTHGLADRYRKGPYPHSCPSIAVPSSLKSQLSMLLLHW